MIAFMLAGLITALAPERQPPSALPPQDWSTLPQLMLRRSVDPVATASTTTSAFVREEVAQGRCAAAVRDPAGWTLAVDVAVLASADGVVRRVVPRAIHCPTVEQYAAGLAWSSARGNVDPQAGDGDRWYRTRLTFAWGP